MLLFITYTAFKKNLIGFYTLKTRRILNLCIHSYNN